MSKTEKLLKRFLSKPKDFTCEELVRLLAYFGYEEEKTGTTAGSRVAFYNEALDDEIKFHKPHPSNIVKIVYLKKIETHLRIKGGIE